MISQIFAVSDDIRYVAIYRDGELETQSRSDLQGASSSETDRYEELLINPVLLKATAQRGNIDCGGVNYLLIRYGNFFQFVMPTQSGHVSVAIEKEAEPVAIAEKVKTLFT